MITFLVEENNPITYEIYLNFVNSIPLNQLTCPGRHGKPCGHKGSMILYGSYKRTFSYDGTSEVFYIVRVMCKDCGATHALIPSCMVPYSQFPVVDISKLISCHDEGTSFETVMVNNPYIDRCVAFSYIKKYLLYWKERLISHSISLMPLLDLVKGCFNHFGYQFMQIKKTPNILFYPPT